MTFINSGSRRFGKRFVSGALGTAGAAPEAPGSRKGIAWLGEGGQLFILAVLGIGAFVLLMMLLSFVWELFGGGGAGPQAPTCRHIANSCYGSSPPSSAFPTVERFPHFAHFRRLQHSPTDSSQIPLTALKTFPRHCQVN